jgi:alpha-tubulin suppressor-like RCC1 family protein
LDEHFWRETTLRTFRLPPQPIRQKGWRDLYSRLSTAKVYTWGHNEYGRLGHSFTSAFFRQVRNPTQVDTLDHELVVDIACGGWTTWVLTDTGKVFACGKVSEYLE